MQRLESVTVVALLVGTLTACGGGGDGGDSGAASGASLRAGPNVVLLTLDTLRADRLGSYGYAEIDTPNLDRLAHEGVRFEQAATTVPITLPAHASILTGRYPHRHGVRENGTFRLSDDAVTLAETLRQQGYATGGFIASFVLDARFGIAQGFDHYSSFERQEAEEEGPRHLTDIQRPGDEVVEEALSWLRARTAGGAGSAGGTAGDGGPEADGVGRGGGAGAADASANDDGRPFFAWIHLYDPHTPYEPPEPWASRYPGRPYDGEVAYTDAVVGRLRRGLEELGLADDTLLVAVGDHGEGLGNHGEQWHTFFVYDSTVRVPLILWAPGQLPAGRVVSGQVSLVDVAPTVLALLDVEDPEAAAQDGIDLRPQIADPDAPGRPVYAESMVPLLHFGWHELRALRTARWKYIEAPRPELYDLRADPDELHDLRLAEPGRVNELRSRLRQIVGDDDPTEYAAGQQPLDPEALQRLEGLGYLAGGAVAADIDRSVDPKDRVEVFEEFNTRLGDLQELVATERWREARREVRRLDEIAPGHFMVLFYRGRVALGLGEVDEAVARLEEALEANPSYSLTYVELSKAYREAGRRERAVTLLQEAREIFPDSFSFPFQLAYLYHAEGRLDRALALYREAAGIIPQQPRLLLNVANLYLARGQPLQALEALEEAVQVVPGDVRAWGNLGTVLGALGRFGAAEEAFRRAVELAPEDPRLHYNLGLVLLRQDRREEAAAAFRRTLELDPGFRDARLQLSRLGR